MAALELYSGDPRYRITAIYCHILPYTAIYLAILIFVFLTEIRNILCHLLRSRNVLINLITLDPFYLIWYYMIWYIWYDMIRYDMILYDMWWYIFNCNWVATRWQLYSTHLHINSTQNDTKQLSLGLYDRASWQIAFEWNQQMHYNFPIIY